VARQPSCLAVSEPGQTSPAYLSTHHGRSISRVVLRSYHKQKTSVRPRNLIDFTRAPVARVTCLPGPENDCAATLRAKLGTLNINPRSTVGFVLFLSVSRCRDVDLERRLCVCVLGKACVRGPTSPGGKAKGHHDWPSPSSQVYLPLDEFGRNLTRLG